MSMPTIECQTLTVAETAIFLGVSKKTVYEQISAGVIPSSRLGKRVLISKQWASNFAQGKKK